MVTLTFNRQAEPVEKPKKVTKSKKKSDGLTAVQRRMLTAIDNVREYIKSGELKPRGDIKLITTEAELDQYLEAIKKNGVVAIDTETTGLDIFNIRICGLCLYTPGMPSVYIPIYHTDIFDNLDERCMNEEVVRTKFKALMDTYKPKTIYHNAKYDLKVLQYIWDIKDHNIYWDTMLGAYILNENEEKGLKPLHNRYIMKGQGSDKDYGDYFGSKTTFNYIPLDVAVIYASNDTIKTYELYEFQAKYLDPNHTRADFRKLYYVFKNIEMPLLPMLVDVELRGWAFDLEASVPLGVEYKEKIDALDAKIFEQLKSVEDKIMANAEIYRLTEGKLENFKFSSPKQAKAFFFDVLKLPVANKRAGQKCDKEALKYWAEEKDVEVAKLLLEHRELSKLYSTYIYKLPSVINKKTMKIHSSFNQASTNTGRFSSSDPVTKINLNKWVA